MECHQFKTTTNSTLDTETMLVYCWSNVADGGPTVNQHCFGIGSMCRSCWEQSAEELGGSLCGNKCIEVR